MRLLPSCSRPWRPRSLRRRGCCGSAKEKDGKLVYVVCCHVHACSDRLSLIPGSTTAAPETNSAPTRIWSTAAERFGVDNILILLQHRGRLSHSARSILVQSATEAPCLIPPLRGQTCPPVVSFPTIKSIGPLIVEAGNRRGEGGGYDGGHGWVLRALPEIKGTDGERSEDSIAWPAEYASMTTAWAASACTLPRGKFRAPRKERAQGGVRNFEVAPAIRRVTRTECVGRQTIRKGATQINLWRKGKMWGVRFQMCLLLSQEMGWWWVFNTEKLELCLVEREKSGGVVCGAGGWRKLSQTAETLDGSAASCR